MKFALATVIAVATTVLATPSFANADLAKTKNCMACHAVDKPLVGPAFKDVAAKYKGQKDAVAKLSEKVMKGGGGVWKMPMSMMPPNAVTADEAKKLVEWVLAQK